MRCPVILDREWFLSTLFDASLLTHEPLDPGGSFFVLAPLVLAPALNSSYFGATC